MNDTIGKSMRFCEMCGVGIGLMTQDEYIARYVHHAGKCPVCGKAAVLPIPKPQEVWLDWTAARARYLLGNMTFTDLIKSREVPYKIEGHHKLVPERVLAIYGRRHETT